jgi:putative transcription factor
MPLCEMCGKEEELLKASIEGVVLAVCSSCSKFGKVLGKVKTAEIAKKEKPRTAEKEIVEAVVSNYSLLIKQKREKLGLKQAELAKRISEKESLLHKIESGKVVPSIELARKLGKFLRIRLIETKEEGPIATKGSSDTYTIGDMVRIRKR